MNPEKLQENPSYIEKLKENLLGALEKAKSPKAFATIVGAAALFGVGEGCTVVNDGPQVTQQIIDVRNYSVSPYQNQFPQYVQPEYSYGWTYVYGNEEAGRLYQPHNVYNNNNNEGHHHHH